MKVIISVVLIMFSINLQAASNTKELSLEKMQMQIEILSNELLKLKTKNDNPDFANALNDSFGFQKVYDTKQGLSIGGYGEIVYQSKESGAATTDAYRFVPYFGYKFNDKVLLNTEIEFEHGGATGDGSKGVAVIEFAYLDFTLHELFNLRAGHILVPMGRVNPKHEPVMFNSVYRPEIEKNIIPSTWHENGLEIYGTYNEMITYSLGVVNSLDLAKNLSSDSWLRSGRQKGAKAKADDLSVFARLDYKLPGGGEVGVSYYSGDSRHDEYSINSARVDLFDIHFDYEIANIEINGLYTTGNVTDSAQLGIGKKAEGYYIGAAYDLGEKMGMMSMSPFIRYSEYNLHKEVAAGVTEDKSLDKEIITVGLNFKPNEKVVLKADYQIRDNAEEDEADVFSLGLGFVF